MDRRRVTYVVLGAVVLLVVAMSASTLTTTQQAPGGNRGSGNTPGQEQVDGDASGNFEIGWYLLFAVVLVFALVTAGSSLRHPGSALRGLAIGLGTGAIIAVVFTILYLLQSKTGRTLVDQPNVTRNNSTSGGGGLGGGVGNASGGSAGDVATVALDEPTVLIVVFLGVVAVGLVAVVVVGREDRGSEAEFEAEEPSDTLEAIAAVAGEAADRLEGDTATENEVYRAWKQMTGLLDVDDPETRTPGEFRRAAVSAGMEPADVDELTELFEDVRYGDASPTAVREERAREALRNVEETYGGSA